MRSAVWGLILLTCFAAHARAQDAAVRGSLGGILGADRTWDDESSLGTGAAIGGRIEWPLFGNTSVEGSIDSLSHQRNGGFFEAEGRTTFTGVSVVQRFGSDTVRPYALAGVHLASYSGSTTFDGRRSERDSRDFGYHFGGGIALLVGERLEVGPEARFYFIQTENDADPALAYWVGVRLGIRF